MECGKPFEDKNKGRPLAGVFPFDLVQFVSGEIALDGLVRLPDRRKQDVEQPHLGGEVE